MRRLNFPEYALQYKTIEDKEYIFDIIRKKYLVVGPEEIVRQHLIHFLIEERHYPKGRINVEKQLILNKMKRRTDLMVFDVNAQPILIAECKAPEIKISQETFEQVARYNLVYQVAHLLVTNGLQHFCCRIDLKNGQFNFLENIPFYKELTQEN